MKGFMFHMTEKISLGDAIFSIHEQFKDCGKQGTLKIRIWDDMISPMVSFTESGEPDKGWFCNPNKAEGFYEKKLGFETAGDELFPFDESLLKEGFEFTIINEKRWRQEMEVGHFFDCSDVAVLRVCDDTVLLRGRTVSSWYSRNLLVRAFKTGIAVLKKDRLPKTITIDDTEFTLTPVIKTENDE